MKTNKATEGAGSNIPKFEEAIAERAEIKHVKGAKQGKKKERLVLSDNKTYAIAAKQLASGQQTSRNPFRKMHSITIKNGDQKVEVNIRSAAKRLGISHQEVRSLRSIDDLEDKAKIREAAINKYEKILEKYEVNHSRLETADTGHKTGIKPKTVLKVVQKGLEISDGDIAIRPGEIKAQNHIFRVSKKGEISDIKMALGAGTFGTVFRTFNLNLAKMEAMKDAFTDVKTAAEQLKNEYNVHYHLRDGDTNAELEGIQACPRELTEISTREGKVIFYQTDLASGDLTVNNPTMEKFPSLNAKEKLGLCGQLLSGLSTAHEKRVVHRDIKPDNCLLEIGSDGALKRFVIADWGGAGIEKNGTASTASYVPFDYYDNKNRGEVDGKQADVFATSKTITETLLGGKRLTLPVKNRGKNKFPIPLNADSKPAKEIKAELKKKGIPEEVADVLISGLGPKESRPDAEKLKSDFNSLVESCVRP